MKKLRSAALVVALLIALPACGGGGGGSGGGGSTGPGLFSVRTMDPLPGSSNLPNDVSVTFHLNAAVDGGSVDDTSVKVMRRGTNTVNPGVYEVSSDGLRITFLPEPWYDVATSYSVEVTESLKSTKGEPLAQRFVGSFSTGPWPSPRAVSQAEFRPVFGGMSTGRSRHTATPLADPNDSVLLAGGFRSGTAVTPEAEVFRGKQEVFVQVGNMKTARANHTANYLDTKAQVLIAGGEKADGEELLSCELFSLASGKFVDAAAMEFPRTIHTATTLPDGRILVTGGFPLDTAGSTAELYDPLTNTWSRTANDMAEQRWGHRATLMTEGRLAGKVLITGGFYTFDNPLRKVEIFDPATNRFRSSFGSLISSRWRHSAVELLGGLVLISDGGERTGEFFDPATESFTQTGNGDSADRYQAMGFKFRDGEVLLVGGFAFLSDGSLFLHATVEQFVLNYGATGKYFSRPLAIDGGVTLFDNRAYSAWAKISDGKFLISGGLGDDFNGPDLDTVTIFEPIRN